MTTRIFCLLLACLLPAFAQEGNSAQKKSDSGVQVKFFAEGVPANLGTVFLLTGETKSAPFDLPVDFMSPAVEVPARAMILKTSAKEIPLCTITLPDTGKAFAIILVAAKPAGYKPIVVRTDDPTFKSGDVFFINRSVKTVLGKLGTTPLILKPGEALKSRPAGAKENAYYDVTFATRDETGDKLISSTRWPIDQLLRSYLIFFTSANGKTSYRAVDEYMTPPADANP